jgi:hypothetical protein
MPEETFYPRFLGPRILEALADTPVVLIHGPRQCGKTTLARLLGDEAGFAYFTFVVLYDGEAVAGFGERFYAVPISKLWKGDG